jgi:hypothetical protein
MQAILDLMVGRSLHLDDLIEEVFPVDEAVENTGG